MYRQRDTIVYSRPASPLNLFLDGKKIALSDSNSLRYAASLSAPFPALDSIWRPVLGNEMDAFERQKDSLLVRIHQLGWKMRFLNTSRNLKSQQQLNLAGRSQVMLSFHNFQLASDVGLYAGRRYLKRSPRYSRLGQEAKAIGMYWGGDFVGFPDPGHVQRFANSAMLLEKYPVLSFEFERFRAKYQAAYQKKLAAGRLDLVQDTEALLIAMNRQRIGKVCACQFAMMPVSTGSLGDEGRVEINTQQNWVYIKPNGENGYYYPLGKWAYLPKN